MFTHSKVLLFLLLSCLTFSVCSYADKPSDKPPASEDVEKAIQRLESMQRRLHGYTVYRREGESFSSVGGDVVFEAQFRLLFCAEEDVVQSSACIDTDVGALVLESEIISTDDDPLVITFDEDNSPDFEAIVEQLTNGNPNDYTLFERQFFVDGGLGGGASSGSTEFSLVRSFTPVAPAVGEIDFEGLEIGSISIRVNLFNSFYDSNEDRTEATFRWEIFFEMPQ